MPAKLPEEFKLLATCCRWPASDERDGEIRQRTRGAFNWNFFLQLAKRHRVEGLVHEALAHASVEVPKFIDEQLSNRAASICRENLEQAAETLRLTSVMESCGVNCVFLKGVALGQIAYQTLGLKQSWDIDLLVEPGQAMIAAAALEEAGYERSHATSGLAIDQLESWLLLCKESHWTHRGTGIVVELHTALVDNSAFLPRVSARSHKWLIRLGSRRVPTLPKDELFAYLCVHGAVHGWARLKWLADVAALLGTGDAAETERLYRRSIELGSGRCSEQALLLCSRLLALELPESLRERLERDRLTRWLANVALSAMSKRGARELDDTIFGTLGINFSHLFLGRGWRYRTRELVRKCSNAEDRLLLPLPRYLSFLYPALALPLWMWRRFRVRHA